MDREAVQQTLRDLGIRPSKRRGQTFLLAEGLARRQVAYVVRPGDRVLEIGPGLGILTQALLEVTDQVVAIEVDPRLCGYLREHVPDAQLIEGDALRVPLPEFDVVVSNLPYRISSKMTFRLLRCPFRAGALMYQREFAERLVASPGTGDYSRLTVHAQHRADVELMERVPKARFHPVPGVDSAVVRLTPRPPDYDVADEGLFRMVVDAAFAHRRKFLENALRAHWNRFVSRGFPEGGPGPDLPHAKRRAQELAPEDFAKLANHLARTKP